jgi:hypothetical protein
MLDTDDLLGGCDEDSMVCEPGKEPSRKLCQASENIKLVRRGGKYDILEHWEFRLAAGYLGEKRT